jgi:hypothetical protein
MKATPEASATTRSPSATSIPAIVTVVPTARSRSRPRAVHGVCPPGEDREVVRLGVRDVAARPVGHDAGEAARGAGQ